MNINTKEYWERRFKSGDWERKSGRKQTIDFASSQIEYFKIEKNFNGKILDFGCGLGDAFPVYRKHFPFAKLVGVDISKEAILKCIDNYGSIAEFYDGDHMSVTDADIIISSNVFEHLSDWQNIVRVVMNKCKVLYVIVPYNEKIFPGREHVNSFNEFSFDDFGNCEYVIFESRGWGFHGLRKFYHLYLKNLVKSILGRETSKQALQIMFKISKN